MFISSRSLATTDVQNLSKKHVPFCYNYILPPRVTRHWGRSQPTWRTPPRVLTCSTCLSNTLALSAQYGVSKECATPQTWSSYMVESPFANTRDSKTTPAGGDEDVMVNTLYLSCAYKPILPHTQQVEVTRRLTNTEISPPSSANPSSSLFSTNRIWPKPSPPCPTNLKLISSFPSALRTTSLIFSFSVPCTGGTVDAGSDSSTRVPLL